MAPAVCVAEVFGTCSMCCRTVFGTCSMCCRTVFGACSMCCRTVIGTCTMCCRTVFDTCSMCCRTVFGTCSMCCRTVIGTCTMCCRTVFGTCSMCCRTVFLAARYAIIFNRMGSTHSHWNVPPRYSIITVRPRGNVDGFSFFDCIIKYIYIYILLIELHCAFFHLRYSNHLLCLLL